MLTLGSLNDAAGIRHGFFTRRGGVSAGLYDSLNCGLGSGDEPDNVRTNRSRAMTHLGLETRQLVTVYQAHSPDVVEIEGPWIGDAPPKADAMVTTASGIALGILTADCAPVLFADPAARVIGAAHAGWRGALTGVVEATIRAMVRRGAQVDRILAGIGPCIAQRSYEVGPEFPAPFVAQDPDNAAFFAPAAREGKFLFDLRGFVAKQVAATGVKHVGQLANDTCREEDRFFSYRRTCQRGERDYGRGLSAIALES
ncbi:MAG: peptidoglycan editing factor PgeF [Rhodospirillales bacterium]|nr:peptidoglycan editing factor PgeF [Rhodospirillales bacterium]